MAVSSKNVAEDIRKALREVQSGSIRGLHELKDIFTRKGRSAEKLDVDDDLIHMIFEVLFEDATKTKSVYSKSKTSRTEATAEGRLGACAAVLRYAVDTWVERIRGQTVKALIDHITQLLPSPASRICKPLRLDYLRTLSRVLDYQPHVEHLPKKRWETVVGFCLNCIQTFGEDLGYFLEISDDAMLEVEGSSDSRFAATPSQKRRLGQNAEASACLEELFRSLSLLTLAPNAPLTDKASDLATSVGAFLQATKSNTISSLFHIPAMKLLNNVLARTSTQSVKLTYAVMEQALPTFRGLWNSKEILLRDEVLIFFFQIQEYLLSMAGREKGRLLVTEMERLLETMSHDYYDALRGVRGHLELDDLVFSDAQLEHETMPCQNHCFSLRKATTKSEYNWSVLHVIAFLTNWIDLHNEIEGSNVVRSGSPELHKRRRKERKFEELLGMASSSNLAEKPYILQVLSFVTARRALDEDEIRAVINNMMPWLTDANANVSSWAMIVLLGCVSLEPAKALDLSDSWKMIWKTVFTMMTSAPHASAASQLLTVLMERECVSYSDMADSLESAASAPNIYGPGILSDSTLCFWNKTMSLRTKFRPSGLHDKSSEEILRWLFTKWNPSGVDNRQHARSIARGLSNVNLARMIYSASGINPFKLTATEFPRLEAIGHAALGYYRSRSLIRYLLLSDEREDIASFWTDQRSVRTHHDAHWLKQCNHYGLMLDFMIAESSKIQERWQDMARSSMHLLTEDVIYIAFSFCLVGTSITASMSVSKAGNKRVETLERRIVELSRLVLRVVGQPEDQTGGNSVVNAIFEAISPFITPVLAGAGHDGYLYYTHLSPLLSLIVEALNTRREGVEASQKQASLEFDDFVSEATNTPQNPLFDAQTQFPRADVAAQSSVPSFFCCTAANLYFVEAALKKSTNYTDLQLIPVRFVEYMLKLPAAELIASRLFLKRLLTTDLQVRTSDAERLLVHLANTFLAQSYEYERCEVSMGLCLDILIGLASLWTDHELESLSEAAEDIYRWFITQVLARRIASSNTQINIINLLYCMLRVSPDFASNSAMPSVRTTLFSVLKEGDVSVQYHIAQRIPEVFELFVLAQHHNVFEDVHSSLPNVEENIEGIFVRLLVLSRLAASWQTLLRRSLYHMVETAGLLETAIPHASMCINQLSVAVKLENPKELLRLFSPQLLYTWSLHHKLADFPFRVFKYDSCRDLFVDVQGEVVSQLMMSGAEDGLLVPEQWSSKSAAELVECDFSQVTAYCFAVDMCSSNSESSPSSHAAETRLRNALSKNKLVTLLSKQLADVVGFLFLRLEGENLIDKALSKRPGYEQAADAFRNMKAAGFSEVPLPPAQQPSFSAKKLLDEIERLCRRCGKDPLTIWTPGLVFVVARMLINDINPVLGSLHSRRIVQRIRILLSLTGNAATKGYALEMIVHALRPLATDPQCAEDTQGCIRFLFENGKAYLDSVPAFVTGTCLSMFLALRDFMTSTQDKTTQESQHRATISSAQKFHQWLELFASTYSTVLLSQASMQLFHTLLGGAAKMCCIEKNGLALAQNKVLRSLLDVQGKGNDLLQGPLKELCLNLFSEQFQGLVSSSEDFSNSDEAAAEYAIPVWRSLSGPSSTSETYMRWAVRLLGRSFVYKGQLPPEITAESNFQQALLFPKAAILNLLVESLQSRDSVVVATVEESLRNIISQHGGPEDRSLIDENIPEALLAILDEAVDSRFISKTTASRKFTISGCFEEHSSLFFTRWIRNLTIALCSKYEDEVLLMSLCQVLLVAENLAEQLFPYVLHIVLLRDRENGSAVREELSRCFRVSLESQNEITVTQNRAILNAIIYLRAQALRQEHTSPDRNAWLEVDFLTAAHAAVKCQMFKSALLFIEIHREQASLARKDATVADSQVPDALLLQIYRQIEDPDSYYGVKSPPTFSAVVDRLDFEGNGVEALLLRGAQADGQLRSRVAHEIQVLPSIVRSVASLNLSSVTHNLIMHNQDMEAVGTKSDELLQAAMKLRKWDISIESAAPTHTAAVYKAFQSVDRMSTSAEITRTAGTSMLNIFQSIRAKGTSGQLLRTSFAALATLTEIDDMVKCTSAEQVIELWEKMKHREAWMENSRLLDISQLLSSREVLFGILNDNTQLRDALRLDAQTARYMEVEANLRSSLIYRKHNALQASLGNITYLTSLAPACQRADMRFEGAILHETASVLWDKGEIQAAIQVSLNLVQGIDFERQSIIVGKAGILATLGYRISEARLERPDEILSKYLIPALKELKGNKESSEAGEVFHEYAAYCYNQLQNVDVSNELQRSEKFRRRKYEEIRNLEQIIRTSRSDIDKRRARGDKHKAKTWIQIDGEEYDRLKRARADSVRQSLDNFLLSLAASDAHETDVLKFVATWLQNAEDTVANESVARYIKYVPTRKFAKLMNQLASRLQDSTERFQVVLRGLVEAICMDHPYHGLPNIFAGSKTPGGNDKVAISRNSAATKVSQSLQRVFKTSRIWRSLYKSNEIYIDFASFKIKEMQAGSKFALIKFPSSNRLVRDIPGLRVPPTTLTINIRENLVYTDVPTITKFGSNMTIASGLSAPKIVTLLTSTGETCRQLYKSGSDDLRQDAIMEQVFAQVTDLLQISKATRQRQLRIRTYNVVPLDASSGAIEFCQPTMPLNDVLIRAHERYYPMDLKWKACREAVAEVVEHTQEARIKVFQDITKRFHPILRHFFFVSFLDPDDWFERRLAYTRSTAAISILGHVLGLGDRHCQNILLDTKTGEVIHIDLGVAFEAGRVLNVPELVPFRLTRDIVDGFGIGGTEGVFRRCCEFTLEALRTHKDAIMTLLNVLRYDPLYSWSLSPLRARRMQEEQDREIAGTATNSVAPSTAGRSTRGARNSTVEGDFGIEPAKKDEDEADEAVRALRGVEKKLATSLSVTAAVNELIQQATDERNLALLFAGWAAFA